jgi:hypothetical protein
MGGVFVLFFRNFFVTIFIAFDRFLTASSSALILIPSLPRDNQPVEAYGFQPEPAKAKSE